MKKSLGYGHNLLSSKFGDLSTLDLNKTAVFISKKGLIGFKNSNKDN